MYQEKENVKEKYKMQKKNKIGCIYNTLKSPLMSP